MQRRQLLQAAAALAPGLVIGFSFAPARANAKSMRKEALDAWLAVGTDGRVTIYSGKVDLGTGVKTALTQMTADELAEATKQYDHVELPTTWARR